jgi:hypothetical protein
LATLPAAPVIKMRLVELLARLFVDSDCMSLTIFTFWEPQKNLLGYLELCLATWRKRLPTYQIVVLDHSNLKTYISSDLIHHPAMSRLTLTLQKDLLMMAVLFEHGGYFLDLDTIVLKDLNTFFYSRQSADLIIIAQHMAFMLARPKSKLLGVALEAQQRRLDWLLQHPEIERLPWDFTANAAFNDALDWIGTGRFGAISSLTKIDFFERINRAVQTRKRQLMFALRQHKDLFVVTRASCGFMPELEIKNKKRNAVENYRHFWFESDYTVQQALRPQTVLLGLHNSWTPDWYKKLSATEIMVDSTLLSKTLQQILA